jgi:hypothetical protein
MRTAPIEMLIVSSNASTVLRCNRIEKHITHATKQSRSDSRAFTPLGINDPEMLNAMSLCKPLNIQFGD